MTDSYEWEACELVYLPMHQAASGTSNTIREYLESRCSLVADLQFGELLNTIHEPSIRLVSRLMSKTRLKRFTAEAFLYR